MRQLVIFVMCFIALGTVIGSSPNITNSSSISSWGGGNEAPMMLRLTKSLRIGSNEFPYMASVRLDGRHYCGGALISRRHVLTAAHCVHDAITRTPWTIYSRVTVMVGSTSVARGGVVHAVDRVAHHGAYQHYNVNPTMPADVAVIRLKRPITPSALVQPIALPRPGQQYVEGQRLVVSGFGASVRNGPTSPVLQKRDMVTTAKATCQRHWQNKLNAGHICATGLYPQGNGVCQGDSGGPLTINRQIVIGIVSATSGYGCGTGIPDLFTKVSHYMNFIRAEMQRIN